MKTFKTSIICLLCSSSMFSQGQITGNSNFIQSSNSMYVNPTKIDSYHNLFTTNSHEVDVRAIANVVPDAFMAIFTVAQSAKKASDVNRLMDERIQTVIKKLSNNKDIEIKVEMISFMPSYAYETEKKMFSKRSYNEIPVGFELKKNINVTYKKEETLNQIMAVFSEEEIYDLAKVHRFSSKINEIKNQLIKKTDSLLLVKLKNKEKLTGEDFSKYKKLTTSTISVINPDNRYQSYYVYSNSSINAKRPVNVTNTTKQKSLYYDPLPSSEYDIVINPIIKESVIHLMYEAKLIVTNELIEEKEPQIIEKERKQYIIITPQGGIKPLTL